jgi:hypothetical protein
MRVKWGAGRGALACAHAATCMLYCLLAYSTMRTSTSQYLEGLPSCVSYGGSGRVTLTVCPGMQHACAATLLRAMRVLDHEHMFRVAACWAAALGQKAMRLCMSSGMMFVQYARLTHEDSCTAGGAAHEACMHATAVHRRLACMLDHMHTAHRSVFYCLLAYSTMRTSQVSTLRGCLAVYRMGVGPGNTHCMPGRATRMCCYPPTCNASARP